MATPVGPVARDPNDPDGWEEWDDPDDDADDDVGAGSRYGLAVRLVALLIVVAFTLLIVVNR